MEYNYYVWVRAKSVNVWVSDWVHYKGVTKIQEVLTTVLSNNLTNDY